MTLRIPARKRLRCTACGTTFFHPLDWIDDDHKATTKVDERIAKLGDWLEEPGVRRESH